MARTNIFRYNEDEGAVLDGWFDPDKATETVDEDTRWDGHNSVSVHTGHYANHQILYRTAGGRWVLHTWSQYQNSTPTYTYIGDGDAKTWLLENSSDDVIERYFGEIEEERVIGRPTIGNPVHIRLGDLVGEIDERRQATGQSRADYVRDLIEQALAATRGGELTR